MLEKNRILLSFQLALFFIILILPIANSIQLLLLFLLWVVTFRKLGPGEWILFILVNIIFTFNNIMAIRNGTFEFILPSSASKNEIFVSNGSLYILGVPIFEVFLWGFYILHTKRMLRLKLYSSSLLKPFLLSILFSLSFSLFPTQLGILLATTASVLTLFMFFHEKQDILCAGYMVFIGTILEHIGVHFGIWKYPGNYLTGVAYWYVNLFAGTGVLLNRLALPLTSKIIKMFTLKEQYLESER
ncbi:MAG: hypothetical protein KDD61_03105 [Bdellovibrionales bacterium]|nr:hypothetical protein [Bdellovibrionales bacterium]